MRGTPVYSETSEDSEFDKRVNHLHEDYRALMDRHQRLKQTTQTPERDKEMDSIVRVIVLQFSTL